MQHQKLGNAALTQALALTIVLGDHAADGAAAGDGGALLLVHNVAGPGYCGRAARPAHVTGDGGGQLHHGGAEIADAAEVDEVALGVLNGTGVAHAQQVTAGACADVLRKEENPD